MAPPSAWISRLEGGRANALLASYLCYIVNIIVNIIIERFADCLQDLEHQEPISVCLKRVYGSKSFQFGGGWRGLLRARVLYRNSSRRRWANRPLPQRRRQTAVLRCRRRGRDAYAPLLPHVALRRATRVGPPFASLSLCLLERWR